MVIASIAEPQSRSMPPGLTMLSQDASRTNQSRIPTMKACGENVYRSRYAIPALDEAQMMGERRLSSLVAEGEPVAEQPSWSTS